MTQKQKPEARNKEYFALISAHSWNNFAINLFYLTVRN